MDAQLNGCQGANDALISSIVELCVGIVITCVPATSVFLRHVLPPTKDVQKRITSYFRNFGTTLPRNQNHTSHGSNSYKKRTEGTNGHYQNLRDGALAIRGKEEHELGLYSANSVKTNVVAGPCEDLHDDRIHLKVDLEQN